MQGPYPPQPLQYQSYPPYPQQPTTSPLAIWSLILGIASWIFCGIFVAIPGVICGHMAIKRIRESGGTIGGRGLAIAGIVVGYLNVGVTVAVLALLVPTILRARTMAQQTACMSNLRQLGIASIAYSNDNKGYLPPNMDVLVSGNYLTVPSPWTADHNVLVCPNATDKTKPSYEMVVTPLRLMMIRRPGQVIVFREIKAHHDGKRCCVYADGHVGVVDETSGPSDGSQPAGGGPAVPNGGWNGGGPEQ